MEDYPKSVALHRFVLKKHPHRALAYYHLGFAYGVMGDRAQELAGYQKAIELGLNDWALFLNLGRLYLETARLDQASSAFRLATLLAPYRAEGHYNLGLTYERLGMLQKAEQETLLALRLQPNQNDAHNTLGIIYAEEGNYVRAYQEWDELARANPDYTPARANLAILKQVERGIVARTAQSGAFAQAP
jgi:tetratricopeptide (TPR) repeat protein